MDKKYIVYSLALHTTVFNKENISAPVWMTQYFHANLFVSLHGLVFICSLSSLKFSVDCSLSVGCRIWLSMVASVAYLVGG